MKKLMWLLLFIGFMGIARADVVFDLYGPSSSEPSALALYLDDEAGPLSYTNSGIVATFSTPDGVMNRTTSGFGINGSSDATTYSMDYGEGFIVSFAQDVQITGLDFRRFEDNGESMNVIIGTITNTITFADLNNDLGTDSIGGISWNVSAGTTVSFTVAGLNDEIAIDSIMVVPEPAVVSLLGAGGLLTLLVRRFYGRH